MWDSLVRAVSSLCCVRWSAHTYILFSASFFYHSSHSVASCCCDVWSKSTETRLIDMFEFPVRAKATTQKTVSSSADVALWYVLSSYLPRHHRYDILSQYVINGPAPRPRPTKPDCSQRTFPRVTSQKRVLATVREQHVLLYGLLALRVDSVRDGVEPWMPMHSINRAGSCNTRC